ncbi:MAG: DUF3108 domain-containing protein [Rhodospirillaceae bacterium]|nr:DUF3108 domain-containing protein [Rhodospirillaceae bacterium]
MRLATIAAFAVTACLGLTAAAAEQKERLLFDVMFGGLHVADVVVSLDQTGANYHSSLAMRTRGMLEWFQDFRADMKSEGDVMLSPSPIRTVPKLYSRAWASPEMASEMTMRFDPLSGAIESMERLYNPVTGAALKPEDMRFGNRRKPVPPVPDDLKAGAIDPIAAFIAARRQILETGQKEVRVPIYDGRRRYDIISKVGTPRNFTIKNEQRLLTPVTSRVEPVFGFEPDSEDRMRSAEGRTLFTADTRFMPVQLVVGNDMFSSVMNLVAECNADPVPCDTFGRGATSPSVAAD